MRQAQSIEKFFCTLCQTVYPRSALTFRCPSSPQHLVCSHCLPSTLRTSKLQCPLCSSHSSTRSKSIKEPGQPKSVHGQTEAPQRLALKPSEQGRLQNHVPKSSVSTQARCGLHGEPTGFICLDFSCSVKRPGCGRCLRDQHARCRPELLFDATSLKNRVELSDMLSLKEDFDKFFTDLVKKSVAALQSQLLQNLEQQLKSFKAQIADLGSLDIWTLGQNAEKIRCDLNPASGKVRISLREESKLKAALRRFDERVRLFFKDEFGQLQTKFAAINFRQLLESRPSGAEPQAMYDTQLVSRMMAADDPRPRPLAETHVPSMTPSEFESLVNLHALLNPISTLQQTGKYLSSPLTFV